MNLKIVVVDDDPKHLKTISGYLEKAGFSVFSASNAEDALETTETVKPDLVILDIVLPEEFLRTGERADGLAVLRRIRESSHVPVLMLSSTTLPSLKVLALDMGADDYMTKPYDSRELIARIHALLRRGRPYGRDSAEISLGTLALDAGSRRVRKDGEVVDLTPLEFDLLFTMARRPGQVFTRQQLIDAVWKEVRYGDERVVDTHIASLRKKIEAYPDAPELIVTVRGAGYRLEKGEE